MHVKVHVKVWMQAVVAGKPETSEGCCVSATLDQDKQVAVVAGEP